jgi:hypothetical protein
MCPVNPCPAKPLCLACDFAPAFIGLHACLLNPNCNEHGTLMRAARCEQAIVFHNGIFLGVLLHMYVEYPQLVWRCTSHLHDPNRALPKTTFSRSNLRSYGPSFSCYPVSDGGVHLLPKMPATQRQIRLQQVEDELKLLENKASELRRQTRQKMKQQ